MRKPILDHAHAPDLHGEPRAARANALRRLHDRHGLSDLTSAQRRDCRIHEPAATSSAETSGSVGLSFGRPASSSSAVPAAPLVRRQRAEACRRSRTAVSLGHRRCSAGLDPDDSSRANPIVRRAVSGAIPLSEALAGGGRHRDGSDRQVPRRRHDRSRGGAIARHRRSAQSRRRRGGPRPLEQRSVAQGCRAWHGEASRVRANASAGGACACVVGSLVVRGPDAIRRAVMLVAAHTMREGTNGRISRFDARDR